MRNFKIKFMSIIMSFVMLISIVGTNITTVFADEVTKIINVNVAVVGMYNEILLKPEKIKVNCSGEKVTAEDALNATGLKIEKNEKSGMITSIEGQKNGTNDGNYGDQSGWMYKINATMPNDVPRTQSIKDGDYLLFVYSNHGDLLPSYDSNENNFIDVTVKNTEKANNFSEKVTVLKGKSTSVAIMEALKKHGNDFDKTSLSSGSLMTKDQTSLWQYRINDDKAIHDSNDVELKAGDTISIFKNADEDAKEDESLQASISPESVETYPGESFTLNVTAKEGNYLIFKTDIEGIDSKIKFIKNGKVNIPLSENVKPGEYTINDIEVHDLPANMPPTPMFFNDSNKVASLKDVKVIVKKKEVAKDYTDSINTIIDNISKKISIDDWAVLDLNKAGKEVPKDYLETVKQCMNAFKQPTDYERVSLAILAAGGDPTNINGVNFIEKIYNGDLDGQGINAVAFGLIALDAGNFKIPEKAKWNREQLVNYLLENKTGDAWSFMGSQIEPDMTGMIISALAPYYKDNEKVKESVDKAVEALSKMQKENGGFESWGTENSESVAMAIIGLCDIGINPSTDKRFIKNGKNLIDALLSFKTTDSDGFGHVDCNYNSMSTDQGLRALVAYKLFKEGKGSVYKGFKVNDTKPNEETFKPIEELWFNANEIEITQEESEDLYANLNYGPDCAEERIIFTSSNPEIATVDEDGNIKGLKPGKTVIKAQAEKTKDIYDECTVTVKEKPILPKDINELTNLLIEKIANDRLNKPIEDGFEWFPLDLKKAGKELPKSYLEGVKKSLKSSSGKLGQPTDYARLTINILAAGGDPTNIEGYNLLEKMCNGNVEVQGINSVIFALIALDAGNFKDIEGAKYNREKLIDCLIESSKESGGWTFFGSNPDPDITGMALSALAPYYKTNAKVKEVVDKSVEALSKCQIENGSFGFAGYTHVSSATSESTAMVIIGLCDIGINPFKDPRFIKNGKTLLDGLKIFLTNDLIGFGHSDNSYNGMATDQGLRSLVAYKLFKEGKGSVYKSNVSEEVKPGENKNIEITNLTKDSVFKLGSDAKVSVQATNNSDKDENASLIIALYDKAGQFINYVCSEQTIEKGKNSILKAMMKMPEKGEYVLKAFVWDTIEAMKELSNTLDIPVK